MSGAGPEPSAGRPRHDPNDDAPLPPEIRALIDAWIRDAGVSPDAGIAVRADLEQHFRDGLRAGRTARELVDAFGDPTVTAPLLRHAVRARRSTGSWSESGRPRATSVLTTAGSFGADLRNALRALRRQPLQASTIVGVLAVGIAAAAVTTTIVNELFLKPLPVAEQEMLVNVLADIPGGNSFTGFSVADFEALRDGNDALAGLAATSAVRAVLGPEPSEERVVVTLVTPGYLDLLGVPAAAGRVELPPFTAWGADAVAIVSHRFWQDRLSADPGVLGSTLVLNGRPHTVIGVAAPPFTGTFIGFPTDVWVSMSSIAAFRSGLDPEDPTEKFLELVGRRRPGVSIADADGALDEVAAGLEQAFPDANRGHRVRVVPLTGLDDSLRAGVLGFVAVIGALAGLVLVVACLNAGAILLVRTMARERELAVRIALGAGAARLARALLTETALMTAAASVLALLLASAATGLLRDFVAVVSGGLGLELSVDARVLALTVGVAVISALLVAAAPAAHVLRRGPASVLRGGTSDARGSRARSVLVTGQVAASVLLVIAAGLFVRALGTGRTLDPGFDADAVASFALPFDVDTDDGASAAGTRREVVARVRALAGVTGVALSDAPPIGVGRSPGLVEIAGVDPPAGASGFVVDVRRVGPGWHQAVGVEVMAGRSFEPGDEVGPPRDAVVNAAFAARFLDDGPVGRTIAVDGATLRVVGVVADVRYVLQDDSPDPLVYLPLPDDAVGNVQVVFGSATPPGGHAAAIRSIVGELRPGLREPEVVTARRVLTEALLPQRLGVVVVGTMGGVALLLAAVGLYGLVQFSVRIGVKALGIRLALGGGRASVVRSVLRSGFRHVAIGLAAGTGAALLVTPALRPFLQGVAPYDPATYALVFGLFALVGLGACLAPALRAARIDPAETLRAE